MNIERYASVVQKQIDFCPEQALNRQSLAWQARAIPLTQLNISASSIQNLVIH